jgi:transcription elongation factor GreA
LEEILATAQVGEAPKAHGVVQQGLVISVELNGSEKKFLLGSAEISDEDIEVYSPDSPIGSAIMGKKIGEQLDVYLPNGKTIQVKILDVTNS